MIFTLLFVFAGFVDHDLVSLAAFGLLFHFALAFGFTCFLTNGMPMELVSNERC